MKSQVLCLTVLVTTTVTVLLLYIKYDRGQQVGFCLILAPLLFLLTHRSFHSLSKILHCSDPLEEVLYYYQQKFKIWSTIGSCCMTWCFIGSFVIALFLLQA